MLFLETQRPPSVPMYTPGAAQQKLHTQDSAKRIHSLRQNRVEIRCLANSWRPKYCVLGLCLFRPSCFFDFVSGFAPRSPSFVPDVPGFVPDVPEFVPVVPGLAPGFVPGYVTCVIQQHRRCEATTRRAIIISGCSWEVFASSSAAAQAVETRTVRLVKQRQSKMCRNLL